MTYGFDSNGNLILSDGTLEIFREEMKKMRHPVRRHTGVKIECSRCGRTWERMSRKAGTLRCHSCGQRIEMEALE